MEAQVVRESPVGPVAASGDPHFGIDVPTRCPDVPAGVLSPRHTWADAAACDGQAPTLAGMFAENFRASAQCVGAEVRAAGPTMA